MAETATPIVTAPTLTPKTATPVGTAPTLTPKTATPVVSAPTLTPPTAAPVVTAPTLTPKTAAPVVTAPTLTPKTATPVTAGWTPPALSGAASATFELLSSEAAQGRAVVVCGVIYTFDAATPMAEPAVFESGVKVHPHPEGLAAGINGLNGVAPNPDAEAAMGEGDLAGSLVITARVRGSSGNDLEISDSDPGVYDTTPFSGGTDTGIQQARVPR